jgi:serine/threonine protein kinase
MAMLRHPYIVQVLDFNKLEDQPSMMMEYVSGLLLSAFLSDLHHIQKRLEHPVMETRRSNRYPAKAARKPPINTLIIWLISSS